MSKPDRTRFLRPLVDESLVRASELHDAAIDALNKREFTTFFLTLKDNATERNDAYTICRLMKDTEDTDICVSDVDYEHNRYSKMYTNILNKICR